MYTSEYFQYVNHLLEHLRSLLMYCFELDPSGEISKEGWYTLQTHKNMRVHNKSLRIRIDFCSSNQLLTIRTHNTKIGCMSLMCSSLPTGAFEVEHFSQGRLYGYPEHTNVLKLTPTFYLQVLPHVNMQDFEEVLRKVFDFAYMSLGGVYLGDMWDVDSGISGTVLKTFWKHQFYLSKVSTEDLVGSLFG